MTLFEAAYWMAMLGVAFWLTVLFVALCEAAAKPTPSPLDRVADYSAEDDLELNWCVLEGGKK